MFQASKKIDDFSQTKVDERHEYNTDMIFMVIAGPSDKFLNEQGKSKFRGWMDNNKSSHDSVNLKFEEDGAKKTYFWDSI